MSSRQIRYIHLFIWLFAIFANLPYQTLGQKMNPDVLVTYIVAFLFLMVVFYVFYFFVAPAFLMKKKLVGFFLVSFVVVLFTPFIGYTLLFFLRALNRGSFADFYQGYSFKMHMSGFFPVLTAAVFGSFFSIIINWFTVIGQKAELDRQKLAAELDLLKSKLNPHFLFNTLNNIDSLISIDKDAASAALIKLSEIMRYLTYEVSEDYVDVTGELRYINNFIDLYRIRLKNPEDLRLKIDVSNNLKVAPALFLPLLENAFKYASFGDTKPSIDINITSKENLLVFEISNVFDESRDRLANSGYGLQNLRKRLELYYPDRHMLLINEEKDHFRAKLTIDTNADKLYSNRR
jgi:two-component sensor histidine kinase